MSRKAHTLIENTRNELANIGASIKTTHPALPNGMKFGYAVAIMMAGEYRKRSTSLDVAWTLTDPTKLATYDMSIKTLTARPRKSQKEATWELRRDENFFISESKTCGRENPRSLRKIVARVNIGKIARLQTKFGKRYALLFQEAMPAIDKHR